MHHATSYNTARLCLQKPPLQYIKPAMSGIEEASDFDEVLALVPLRCRVCKYGQRILGLAWAFDSSTGALEPTIEEMRDVCGHEDELPEQFAFRDPETEAAIIDTDAGPMLFMPFPEPAEQDDCPLRTQQSE